MPKMSKTCKPKKNSDKGGHKIMTCSEDNDPNIRITCTDCSKKLYPNAGKFTEKQLKKAKLVKAMFTEEGKMSEHMWVKVEQVITTNNITHVHGTLNNDPVDLTNIKFGDVVMVSASKVEDIRLTEEPEEENITCELCNGEYPVFLDTGMAEYFLCDSHLVDLVIIDLTPKDVKTLRTKHGDKDYYINKDFYGTKGQNLHFFDKEKK
jgi:Uncharacterized protein conserved in bacteria (DUF2314)